jgi:ABC-2 type transport system ATP-binding protein
MIRSGIEERTEPHAGVVLQVHEVGKRFRQIAAVDRLSFRVNRGEIFALLGPNGAGKTTLVRMLLGILRPDSGTIAYDLAEGSAHWPDAARLGYLPEDRGLYKDLPILRVLTFFGVLRGMERSAAAEAAGNWLERLGLRDRARERLDSLSKGNQQKVQLAAALLHRPAFAVLDEPFSGLDPVNQELFLDLIRELCRDGMTVLLSAHQMNLVERLADRVLLMNQGRAVLRGTLAEIRQRAGGDHRLRLRLAGPSDLSPLANHPEIRKIERLDDEVVLWLRAVTDGQGLGSLSQVLTSIGGHLPIAAISSEPISLHDIFVQAVAADTPGARRQ